MTAVDLDVMRDAVKSLVAEASAIGFRSVDCVAAAARTGWSVRRVVACWRVHAAALGGRYVPTRTKRGDHRAFNPDDRRTRIIPARIVFDWGPLRVKE